MFTGIIEAFSEVIQSKGHPEQGYHLSIAKPKDWNTLQKGESVSVNGVCLTLTQFGINQLDFTVVPQTIRQSNLGQLVSGNCVNLERSLLAGSRMSGHFVQGHVEGVSIVKSIRPDGEAYGLKLSLPSDLKPYVINKGFIALDGMSLTVAEKNEEEFSVTLVPYTWSHTIASSYHVGSRLNIETDSFAKTIHQYLSVMKKEVSLT